MRQALLLLAIPLAGCLSHLPPDASPDHLAIGWRSDFEEARVEASRTGRPLLLLMIGGDLTGSC